MLIESKPRILYPFPMCSIEANSDYGHWDLARQVRSSPSRLKVQLVASSIGTSEVLDSIKGGRERLGVKQSSVSQVLRRGAAELGICHGPSRP